MLWVFSHIVASNEPPQHRNLTFEVDSLEVPNQKITSKNKQIYIKIYVQAAVVTKMEICNGVGNATTVNLVIGKWIRQTLCDGCKANTVQKQTEKNLNHQNILLWPPFLTCCYLPWRQPSIAKWIVLYRIAKTVNADPKLLGTQLDNKYNHFSIVWSPAWGQVWWKIKQSDFNVL